MPALLVVLVLLLAGCVPGAGRGTSDGIPTPDAPFTLTALDVGQPTFRVRCMAVWRERGPDSAFRPS
jgi:hypothetical protein